MPRAHDDQWLSGFASETMQVRGPAKCWNVVKLTNMTRRKATIVHAARKAFGKLHRALDIGDERHSKIHHGTPEHVAARNFFLAARAFGQVDDQVNHTVLDNMK